MKSESHEVSMVNTDVCSGMLLSVDFSNICGYGESYEEALKDFKKKFREKFDKLKYFENLLFETDSLIPIPVDCLGKRLKCK